MKLGEFRKTLNSGGKLLSILGTSGVYISGLGSIFDCDNIIINVLGSKKRMMGDLWKISYSFPGPFLIVSYDNGNLSISFLAEPSRYVKIIYCNESYYKKTVIKWNIIKTLCKGITVNPSDDLINTLNAIYAEDDNFKRLVELMNMENSEDPPKIQKTMFASRGILGLKFSSLVG